MSAPPSSGDEFTIDHLAARAGMTVRNVRAHLSRELLPPGRMRGRTAWYGPGHLARLGLIADLQRRGFSLAAIGVLVNQAPSGSAEEALRLYRGMLAPWQPEEPVEIGVDELASWAAAELSPDAVARLVETRLVEPAGPGRLRIVSPSMVRAGAQAIALGMAPEAVVAAGDDLLGRTAEIAELFIGLFRDQVRAVHPDTGLSRGGIDGVRTAAETLQPVATQVLLGAFRRSMLETLETFVAQLSDDLAARAATDRHRDPDPGPGSGSGAAPVPARD